MKPTEKASLLKSYNSYKRHYREFRRKGYTMDNMMNFKTYKKRYKEVRDLSKSMGEKVPNISLSFAKEDRNITYGEARHIVKTINEAKKNKTLTEGMKTFIKDYNLTGKRDDYKKIIGRKFDTDEVNDQGTLLSNRAQLFNDLINTGLSYKEAEKVMYV